MARVSSLADMALETVTNINKGFHQEGLFMNNLTSTLSKCDEMMSKLKERESIKRKPTIAINNLNPMVKNDRQVYDQDETDEIDFSELSEESFIPPSAISSKD